MITFLCFVYVMVCVFLILVVLLQAGKGGMGAAFGGSSQTVFGSSGSGNFLTRLTVIVAALFMMLSATLTYVSSSGEKSLENASERVRQREEARSGKDKDAKDKDKKPETKAAEGAATSSESTSAPGAAAPADTTAPVETAPSEETAPPAHP